ncbi:MAG: uroporphyrinogen-III synthase [Bacteroidales bacterium]|jgi:uroporphyrinogen-III synthase|nr:uroporphyrinogen-III synthase [Bacteroidales bacterium]
MEKKEISKILISQPVPADLEKSQYKVLIDKYKVELTFEKFFNVVGVSNKEFRAKRISLLDYTAVIITSKLAVDNYFRIAKELRIKIPETMKYFCITETIANYLQNYIQYRKRKVFFGKITFKDLQEVIAKHKDEKYIFPCAEDASAENFQMLDKAKINYKKAVMFRSEPKDLKHINIQNFDMVAVFSPIGAKSFIQSFPTMKHNDIVFAAFGSTTQQALKNAKIKVLVPAPNTKYPSMIMAIDNFLSLKSADFPKYLEELEAEALAIATKKKEELAKAIAKAKRDAKKIKVAQQIEAEKKNKECKKETVKQIKTKIQPIPTNSKQKPTISKIKQ